MREVHTSPVSGAALSSLPKECIPQTAGTGSKDEGYVPGDNRGARMTAHQNGRRIRASRAASRTATRRLPGEKRGSEQRQRWHTGIQGAAELSTPLPIDGVRSRGIINWSCTERCLTFPDRVGASTE